MTPTALQVHWQMKSLKVNFDMKIGQTSATEVQKGNGGKQEVHSLKTVINLRKVKTLLKHAHVHSPWQVLLNHFSHLTLQIQDGSLTPFSKRTVAMQLSPYSAALQVEDGVSP